MSQCARWFSMMTLVAATSTSALLPSCDRKTSGGASRKATIVFEDEAMPAAGPCRLISVREASEVVGVQMRYLSTAADDTNCHLLPKQEAGGVPDLTVAPLTDNVRDYDMATDAIVGVADQARWIVTGNLFRLVMVLGPRMYSASIIWPAQSEPEIRAKVLALAAKVKVRALAIAAEAVPIAPTEVPIAPPAPARQP
jgi:hypothetical protein